MKRFLLMLAAAMLPLPGFAQAPQPAPVLTPGTSNTWNLDWEGVTGRTYFLQHSDNLVDWQYFPLIESGAGQPIGWGFSSSADRFFVRLKYTDEPTTDPDNDDFDFDFLTNWEEVATYHTDPFNDDTDGDGIWDDYEVFGSLGYVTDPNSADTDGDGLADLDEIEIYNSDPTITDVDGDGDGLLNPIEVWLGLDPALTDTDGDGITDDLEDADYDLLGNLAEFSVILTNPKRYDTDLDTLNDGWEVANGFDPRVNNLSDANPLNDPGADPDNDGLTNSEEETIGTNPNDPDSDGDGVDDRTERDQGSNPNDPNDDAPPPAGTVPLNVTFGDDSGSHSEKYRVLLTPLEGDTTGHTERFRTNREYGESQTDTFHLPKGAKYRVELIHIDTNEDDGVPDYDHTLDIDTSQGCLVVDDPESIMGTSPESGGATFVIEGKSATLHVPLFEWVTPKDSPVTAPDDAGDGQNEFTYDAASPGVLTIDLKVLVKPTGTAGLTGHDGVKFSDRCVYTLPTIAGSTFAWDAANPGGKSTASGEQVIAKATYTTLPALNTEFGLKEAEFKCDSETDVLPKAEFEAFYMAQEKNHPGGDPAHPNWFHYYKQNSGGGSYTYDSTPGARSSSVSNGGESTIKIGDYVHSPGGEYITTTIVGGQLKATGWSSTNKYYAHFVGVLAHERQHALGEVTQGGPDDPDSDWLSTDLETNYSQTDPADPVSASSGVSAVAGFTDDEVYAGGPIEEVGVTGADTSQDWANPGTNHK